MNHSPYLPINYIMASWQNNFDKNHERHIPTPICSSPEVQINKLSPIMVVINDPYNVPDPLTGYGSVDYEYQIGKYLVTIGEYINFLNAVASKTDPNGLYNSSMESDKSMAGISKTFICDKYIYKAINPSGNNPIGADSLTERPIANLNWFSAARFANWMSNGQLIGNQTSNTTENRSYDLTNISKNFTVMRNKVNPNTGKQPLYFIPSNNELYKAAFYSPSLNNGAGGYYTYATQSNSVPDNKETPTSSSNCVNYIKGVTYCVTQSSYLIESQNYLTDVGFFAKSKSYYGVYDLNGLVYNMFEFDDIGKKYGIRGGFWAGGSASLTKTSSSTVSTTYLGNDTGFRLISL